MKKILLHGTTVSATTKIMNRNLDINEVRKLIMRIIPYGENIENIEKPFFYRSPADLQGKESPRINAYLAQTDKANTIKNAWAKAYKKSLTAKAIAGETNDTCSIIQIVLEKDIPIPSIDEISISMHTLLKWIEEEKAFMRLYAIPGGYMPHMRLFYLAMYLNGIDQNPDILNITDMTPKDVKMIKDMLEEGNASILADMAAAVELREVPDLPKPLNQYIIKQEIKNLQQMIQSMKKSLDDETEE